MDTNSAGSTRMTEMERASKCSPKNFKFTRASGLLVNSPEMSFCASKLTNLNQFRKKSGSVA